MCAVSASVRKVSFVWYHRIFFFFPLHILFHFRYCFFLSGACLSQVVCLFRWQVKSIELSDNSEHNTDDYVAADSVIIIVTNGTNTILLLVLLSFSFGIILTFLCLSFSMYLWLLFLLFVITGYAVGVLRLWSVHISFIIISHNTDFSATPTTGALINKHWLRGAFILVMAEL